MGQDCESGGMTSGRSMVVVDLGGSASGTRNNRTYALNLVLDAALFYKPCPADMTIFATESSCQTAHAWINAMAIAALDDAAFRKSNMIKILRHRSCMTALYQP